MKADGMATMLRNLIVIDPYGEELVQAAAQANMALHFWRDVSQSGENGSNHPFDFPQKDDIYIFSYTSGTTGDSKGAKLSHDNIICNLRCMLPRLPMIPGESYISYLPYTHGYEQCLLGQALVVQLKIGYYSGDPTRLA